MKKSALAGALILISAVAQAVPPNWTTTVGFPMNPLPIGFCTPVYVGLKTSDGKSIPRDRLGYLMDLSQFDLSLTGTDAVGAYNGASNFNVCGCQGATIGATVTVTAKYPAQSLPEAKRWPGVAYESSAVLTLKKPGGTLNPAACVAQAAAANNALPAPAPVSAPATGTALPTNYPPVSVVAAPGQPPATGTVSPANYPAVPVASVPPPPDAAPATGAAPPASYPPVPVAAAPGRQSPASAPAAANPHPPAVPVNPTKFVAVQTGPGVVKLAWTPVSGAEFFVVFGPGLAQGGQRVDKLQVGEQRDVGGSSVVATNVPAGMQEWAVASYFPNNVTTAGSSFTRVSLNVTAPAVTASAPSGDSPPTSSPPTTSPATQPSGPQPKIADKYLVTITGLRAYQMSADDMLSRDGVGDEVYAAVYVRTYDQRTSQLAAVETRVSAVHGDVNKFGQQRLQAGTKSGTGGIQDGDMIPDGGFIATRTVPASNSTFPFRIFEGTLVDGVEALLISPSIWEQDGSNSFFLQWQQNQATLNASLFAKPGVHDEIAQKSFKPLKFGMSGNDANTGGTSLAHAITDSMIMMGGGGIPIIGLLSQSADRPLGLQENGRDQTALPNHVIVLTREIIEAALARPALGPIPSPVANGPSGGLLATPAIARVGVIATKPGVMVLQFEDRNVSGTLAFPERPAIYQMYIQVERIP